MNCSVSTTIDGVTLHSGRTFRPLDPGVDRDAAACAVASARGGVAVSSAPWPVQLVSGLAVVVLHLVLALALLRSPSAPLIPPQPEVVAVRWMAEAAPQPPAPEVPREQASKPPVVASPNVVPAAKPKPVVKRQPVRKPTAEAHPQPERPEPAAVEPKAAPIAAAKTNPQPASTEPIREPQYRSATLRNPAPSYPPLSRRFGEQGSVMLRVLVSVTGEPLQVELLTSSGYARLDTAARKMVAKWHFVPAQRGQEKIQAWVRVPVVFQLRKKS